MPRRSFLGYNALMRRRNSLFRWLSGWLLLSMLGVGILGGVGLSVRAAPRQQAVGSVVISEFRTNGPNGGTDEFIELFNQTSSNICIENWQLRALTGTGNEAVRATIPAGVAIGPGSHYLIANNGYGGTADLTYGTGIVDNGGIAIFDDNGVKIDSVGTSSTFTTYAEGTSLNPLTGNQDQSYHRSFDSGMGIYIDTDDNSSDFQIVSPSTPENSIGSPATCNFAPLSVIISEVAWAGTKAYFGDEWIELYNPGAQTIQLDGWILTNESGSFYISFDSSDSIGSGNFFLIEHGSGNATSEPEQKTYTSGSLLSDNGEAIYLLAPDRSVVDTANASGGAWPAGGGTNSSSMERVVKSGVVEPDGKFAWITNVGTVRNGQDAAGNDIYGTPGQTNWAFSVSPTQTPAPTKTPAPTAPLTIVISEVAWAGTQSSSDDEWIELYNPGSQDVNLTGWNLRSSDGSPNIQSEFDGIILGSGEYLLLERTDDDPTDVDADVIYSGSLSNSGEILRLYDSNGYLVDTANSNGGAWPAGLSSTYSSMQRSLIATDSNFVWVTYDPARDNNPNITKAKDASGNQINGTPGRGNTPFNVTTTPTPGTGSSGGSSGSTGDVTLPPILGISEFLPRPGYDWNNDGVVDVFDEFIEIINAGQISVNLSSYRLDDEENLGSPPYTLPSLTLQPGERAVFYGSDTGILLSDAGDTVRLLRGSTVVDAYTYGVVRYPDQAWCRIPDRLGYWNKPCFPTPNNPNALTGTAPLPPEAATSYRPPVCLLPDTTPDEFVYAECEVGGDDIWNRQYWDDADAPGLLKLSEKQKWEIIFE